MSGFEFNGFSEGEWESHEELAWSERDWQRYLKNNEKEITAFLAHYHQLKPLPLHLDQIARNMGWDFDEWTPSELNPTEFQQDNLKEEDLLEPYTIHKQPVYIVTRGLYEHLFESWEHFTTQHQDSLSPVLAAQLPSSLHNGEMNALIALSSLELEDFSLTVCHLKKALTALNQTMKLLQQLALTHCEEKTFQSEFMATLFDLREVWLRIMNDCREETRRHKGDQE